MARQVEGAHHFNIINQIGRELRYVCLDFTRVSVISNSTRFQLRVPRSSRSPRRGSVLLTKNSSPYKLSKCISEPTPIVRVR